MPSAYKNPGQIKEAISWHNLANIVDRILPRGSIMAGEQPSWRNHKKEKTSP